MDTLDGFSNYLAMNEGSEATKKNYLRTVKRMLAEPDYSLTREWIMAYREKLAENFAPVTVNNCLAAINQYIQYCGKDWKIKSLRIQKRVYMEEQRELTLEEYRRLAAAIRKNQRLYMAIQTVCSTGIRISELRCLTVECLEKQTAEISCKGKIRRIYLSDQLTQKLLAYCRSRKITEGMIFITRSGAPWDRSNIWRGDEESRLSGGDTREQSISSQSPPSFRKSVLRKREGYREAGRYSGTQQCGNDENLSDERRGRTQEADQ